MKKQADQRHSERSFAVHDLVFLKLQPYVQPSLAPCSHHKLAFRFFRPFRIVPCVGTVVYRLVLPAHSSIHPIFHVSQMKKAVGPQHEVIPSLSADYAIHLAPEQILQSAWFAVALIKCNKYWSNGTTYRQSCPPGRIMRLFVKSTHEQLRGDK